MSCNHKNGYLGTWQCEMDPCGKVVRVNHTKSFGLGYFQVIMKCPDCGKEKRLHISIRGVRVGAIQGWKMRKVPKEHTNWNVAEEGGTE